MLQERIGIPGIVRSYGEIAGDAKRAAPSRILKSTTRSFAVTPVMITQFLSEPHMDGV